MMADPTRNEGGIVGRGVATAPEVISMRTRRFWLLTLALSSATLVACSGRSQIDFADESTPPGASGPMILPDASTSDAAPAVDAGVDGAGGAGGAGGEGGTAGVGGAGGEGAGGSGGFSGGGPGGGPPNGGPDGGIIGNAIQCIQCVQQSCPAISQCLIQDATCRQGVLCVFQKCAGFGGGGMGGGGMGGFDPQCALQCFNGDFNAALQAFNGVQCFFSNCGQTCGGLLPGLGGGGGFPGFPGGGGGEPAP
jgi:hypothetical protein